MLQETYGNLYSKSCHTAVNKYADEADQILFDVCCVLYCNVWSNSSKVNDFEAQLSASQKLFESYKGMDAFERDIPCPIFAQKMSTQ